MATDKSRSQLCQEALQLLANGKPLRRTADELGVPFSTLRDWLTAPEYADQYTRARESGWHVMAEEILDISDDGQNDWVEKSDPNNAGYALNGEHVQRSRLRVDSRKWLLSKMLPKVYGDKVGVDVSGPDGEPIRIARVPAPVKDMAEWLDQSK